MSAHNDLPPELSEIETQLGQLSVAAAKVDRDATLFDAGWAAADAQWQQRARRARVGWRTTTGVLAASVAVLALILFDQRDPPRVVDATKVAASPRVERRSPARPQVEKMQPSVRRRATWNWKDATSLLARRDMALRGGFAEPLAAPDDVAVPVSQLKTARELLEEFLPNERSPS